MATCIDFYMRQLPEAKREKEPLNADDQVLQELYAEATTFWAAVAVPGSPAAPPDPVTRRAV